MRLVVAASAAGTAFEWYDFFVFVPLASIIAKNFAGGLSDAGGYVFALGSFAAGLRLPACRSADLRASGRSQGVARAPSSSPSA